MAVKFMELVLRHPPICLGPYVLILPSRCLMGIKFRTGKDIYDTSLK